MPTVIRSIPKPVWVALAAFASACASNGRPRVVLPEAPGEGAKCKVAASHENPLVTEWAASEKANLEARLREGAVVVAYSGCSLRMLPQCKVRGGYGWRRTTTTTDVMEIRDSDELYAKLPLGAATLEGELSHSGRLAVQTTVSGQLELAGFDAASVPGDGSCLGATHVIGSLSIGAFKLRSGGTVAVKGGAVVPVIGSGSVGTRSEESLLREAGNPDSCKESTAAAPHTECSSPIQVFLRPLPTAFTDRGPAGTVKVTFVSGVTEQQWKVEVGDRELCSTPCERFVDPAMPFTLRGDAGFLQQDHRADVPDLRTFGEQPLLVRAYPRSQMELAGGITMASFGGMAVISGLALAGVGCFGNFESAGKMCVGGLITIPIGGLVTAPGVWLIYDSLSRVEVSPRPAGMPAPEALGPEPH